MKALRFDLHHLRAFKVLAHELHFKKAAHVLCITQSALSRLIKSLEDALDAPLFTRNTRYVQLTVAGELFLQEVEIIFRNLYRSIDLVKKADTGIVGNLKIGYNDFVIQELLPKIVKTFQQNQSDIRIDLIYIPTQKQIRAIEQYEIDIGFLLSYGNELPVVHERRLKEDHTVVILPKTHRLAQEAKINLADLSDEYFILGAESDWSSWRNYFFNICLQAGFLPRVAQEITSSSGIMSLVAANMGIAILSQSLRNYLRPELIAIDLECVMNSTFISAVSLPDSHNPCVNLFLTCLDELIESKLL